MFWTRLIAFFLTAVFSLGGALFAQDLDPFFAQTEFSAWARQAPVEQIPWQLHVEEGGLTAYQRIIGRWVIGIPGRYFKQRRQSGDLVAMIQVTDSAGHIYQNHSVDFIDSKNPEIKNGAFVAWRALVLPGDYDTLLALYDKATGTHSFAARKLHVEPLNHDPLPDAWKDLPALELVQVAKPPESFFHPEIKSRLYLPVAARRPVRIELMANLTGTGRAMVSHGAYDFNLTTLLPIMKAFSNLEVRGGALNIEFIDLVRRTVPFREENSSGLDWEHLKTAVLAADPSKVDVHALQDIKHTAAFLRQEVARRIASGNGPPSALPVIILVSSSAFFDKLDDINDTTLSAECGCIVYYIRYNPVVIRYNLSYHDFDNMKKVLRPLPVRSHLAQSTLDLRRIMAQIMDEVSKM